MVGKASLPVVKSLYRELTIALVTLVTLVSIAVNAFNYFYSVHDVAESYGRKTTEYTAHLREQLEWPLWNIDDELMVRIGSAFMSNAEISSLTICDDQDRVIFHQRNTSDIQNKRMIEIEHNGQNIGHVEISLSLTSVKERERNLLWVSIASMLLLAATLLGVLRWILSRLLEKPIDALVAATEDMVAGRYQQLALTETYEEFSLVLKGFKVMSDVVENRETSLRASEAKLLSILENVDACIYLKDTAGRYLFANRPVRALWQVEMQDLIGFGDEKFFDAATVANIKQNDKRVLVDGETLRTEEINTVPLTGKVVSYQSTKLPLYREDGSIYALCGISVDITERKQIEAQLRQYKDHLAEEVQTRTADLVLARDAAEAANKAKSAFLANMSHELRTPLNAILGFSSLMSQDSRLEESQKQNLDIINRSGTHLLTLINDALEMAKIEAGRTQLENAPFDLGIMVRDVVDMMELRARQKGLQLLLDQSSQFPRYIQGDEARLRQILINLLGNAVKFTQQGGVTLRLATKQNTIAHLLIEVEDSGLGIAIEDQTRLFQPFVQLGKQAGDNKGSGLGLSITQQFVQLMGGRISVISTLGQGSIFKVELPLNVLENHDAIAPQAGERGDVIGLEPNQSVRRILIVEDQLENQLLLTQLMQRIGFEVNVAEDGAQGVQLFQSWHPDLIFMDRRMPVMDGMAATQSIRNLPGGKEVKIIAVTASAFVEQREEMMAAGMDDFVRKPYRFNEIYDALSRQLGVQYVYAEVLDGAEKSPPVTLTAEMLSGLPPALRDELRDALESLEDERIRAVLIHVTPLDATLYKTLSHLVDNFDYASVLRCL